MSSSPLRRGVDMCVSVCGITTGQAWDLVGVSHRQADLWVRKSWVTPSVDPGAGKSGRRLFGVDDVVRLGLLCHLERSRRNLKSLGPQIASLSLEAMFVVATADDVLVTASGIDELMRVIKTPGAYTVCDSWGLRSKIAATTIDRDSAVSKIEEIEVRASTQRL